MPAHSLNCSWFFQKSMGEVNVMDCMRLFTREDVLDGDEKPVSLNTDVFALSLCSYVRPP